MYRKILVGYDGSEQSKDALALGKQLADVSGARLTVAGVSQFDPVWRDWDPHFQEVDAELAQQLEAAAGAVGAVAKAIPSSSPARGLLELAERIDADLIVVGSSHRGRGGQILAGSTGLALLHGSSCAVAIAPHGYRERASDAITRVAVGFDGSEESGQALMVAGDLARNADAKVSLISVAVPPPVTTGKGGMTGWHGLLEAIEDQARERLSQAREAVPDDVEADGTLISGDPVDALSSAADQPGTVMVVGSRGYGPLRRVLLGSVSRGLMEAAPSPLIVTPRGVREGRPAEAASAAGPAA